MKKIVTTTIRPASPPTLLIRSLDRVELIAERVAGLQVTFSQLPRLARLGWKNAC